ncbi:MAG: zinc ribbon domain-containing protein [Desulfovibrionaceae bacterium]
MEIEACGEHPPEEPEHGPLPGEHAAHDAAALSFEFTPDPLCPRCGEPAPELARFCPKCGEPLAGTLAAPAWEPEPESEQDDALYLEREAAHALPYVHWFVTLVYSLLTLGLYQPIWLLRRRWGLRLLSRKPRLSSGVLWCCLVYLGVSLLANLGLGLMGGVMEEAGAVRGLEVLGALQGAFTIADGVLSLVVALILLTYVFRVRRILLDHFERMGRDVKVRWIWTLLLSVVYLQHKVNVGILRPYMEK